MTFIFRSASPVTYRADIALLVAAEDQGKAAALPYHSLLRHQFFRAFPARINVSADVLFTQPFDKAVLVHR